MGRCLIEVGNVETCLEKAGDCSIKCIHGDAQVKFPPGPERTICEKNCGIDYAKCIITNLNLLECSRQEAACALDCLKLEQVEVDSSKIAIEVERSGDTCQKNCGIDYAKCMITQFDIKECSKQEAVCALDCLKSVQVKHSHSPHLKSLKCSACQFAAGKIEGVIARSGCGLADAGMTAACQTAFGGPEDPLADICTIGFIRACPTLAGWIAKKAFSPIKACQLIHLC